jgi:hypothetical protein
VARAQERLAAGRAALTAFADATGEARGDLASVTETAAEVMTAVTRFQLDTSGRVYAERPGEGVLLQRELARAGLSRLHGTLSLRVPGLADGSAVTPADATATLAEPARVPDLVRTRSLIGSCVARHEQRRLLAAERDGGSAGPGETESRADPLSQTLTIEEAQDILRSRAVGQIADMPSAASRDLLRRMRDKKRADAGTLGARLDALELRGGPADAVAYHDFHSLQIAFRNVWRRVFDEGLRARGEELYERWVAVRRYAGLGEPTAAARGEFADLRSFLTQVERDLGIAAGLSRRTGTLPGWDGAANPLEDLFGPFVPRLPPMPGMRSSGLPTPPSPRDVMSSIFSGGLSNLFGGGGSVEAAPGTHRFPPPVESHLLGRISGLTLDLARRLSESYQFDVFEPNSYNFGLLTTYRQRWEPISYQAGELVASIPLAPGEKRKLSTKLVVKSRREEVREEAAASTSSSESTGTMRADAEIVNRASSTTNFNQSVQGQFGFGDFLQLTTTSQFSNNQERHSEQKKRDFRESVRKAADEYKRERKLEIKTAEELESTTEQTQEIANPNTEITVTYLFYELQRRYKVSERLHRVRPVILVAQDVPAPDQIDEGFLVAHEWILRRALLDASLKPALDHLVGEFPGDELGVAVLRTSWERNLQVVDRIAVQLDSRSALRDRVRTRVLELLQGTAADETGRDVTAAILSGGLSLLFGGGSDAGAQLEAAREAADRELEYTESEMAEIERRLKQAMSVLEESTQKYVEASRAQLNRRTAVDQLRVHVKQNILYYMQAIWSHEPPDQRFFRLYDQPIDWFEVGSDAAESPPTVRTVTPAPGIGDADSLVNLLFGVGAMRKLVDFPIGFVTLVPEGRRLGDVADLDSMLGFKGNYMIFPLKENNALTAHMMQDYVENDALGVLDPDDFANYDNDELATAIRCVRAEGSVGAAELEAVEQLLLDRLTAARRDSEEIIVPTGQLFIEALPGEHPVLEDFKLVHRQLDAEKVDAEARLAYLEVIRSASLLNAGEWDDHDVDRLIRIEGAGADVEVNAE